MDMVKTAETHYASFNPLPHKHLLMLLQTEQIKIGQLSQELPDQGSTLFAYGNRIRYYDPTLVELDM